MGCCEASTAQEIAAGGMSNCASRERRTEKGGNQQKARARRHEDSQGGRTHQQKRQKRRAPPLPLTPHLRVAAATNAHNTRRRRNANTPTPRCRRACAMPKVEVQGCKLWSPALEREVLAGEGVSTQHKTRTTYFASPSTRLDDDN